MANSHFHRIAGATARDRPAGPVPAEVMGTRRAARRWAVASRGGVKGAPQVSVFTPAEIAYLRSQRLGRLATVGPSGQPHVVPVGFRYNADQDTVDIGGHGFATRKKFPDASANPRVAFLVVDLASVTPWYLVRIESRV